MDVRTLLDIVRQMEMRVVTKGSAIAGAPQSIRTVETIAELSAGDEINQMVGSSLLQVSPPRVRDCQKLKIVKKRVRLHHRHPIRYPWL